MTVLHPEGVSVDQDETLILDWSVQDCITILQPLPKVCPCTLPIIDLPMVKTPSRHCLHQCNVFKSMTGSVQVHTLGEGWIIRMLPITVCITVWNKHCLM